MRQFDDRLGVGLVGSSVRNVSFFGVFEEPVRECRRSAEREHAFAYVPKGRRNSPGFNLGQTGA